ncbi:MAG: CopG family transcriptional regulator [Bryobacteraceae bacterium]
MKTAVSIPDEVFQGAEKLARKSGKSRSQLYSDAIAEYLSRHSTDEVTDSMNRVCARLGDTSDEFASEASRQILERSEW